MNPARLFYRTHQFWRALAAQLENRDMDLACKWLPPAQAAIFRRLQPADQAHSLALLERLISQGECHPDLLAAALLHDVGKTLYPLKLWERVWIVLAYALAPGWVKRKGGQPVQPGEQLPAWQKALVVAEQHPVWGAQLAAQAGSSPLVLELIRRHHEKRLDQPQSPAEILLHKLQSIDNAS